MLKNEILEELRNFLGANFHQDIESIEEAIEEFLEEADKERLIQTMDVIIAFIDLNICKNEKINLIKKYTYIKFENDNEYFEFIEAILDKIKHKLEN